MNPIPDSTHRGASLSLERISKHFAGVHALRQVSLAFFPGQIHALVGENGAGKSTLINIATGVLQPDEGDISIRSEKKVLPNPRLAAQLGIVAVHQEADLFPDLSLAENMLLSQGLVRNHWGMIHWGNTYQNAQQVLTLMDEQSDVRLPAGSLSVGQRVIADIAAAVARKPQVIFLDEPTAALTATETQRLFILLKELRQSGVAIVYVSHRLEEVLQISDVTSVLRDGNLVTTQNTSGLDMNQLVSLMVGRETSSFFSRNHSRIGQVVLEGKGLACPDKRFQDIDLSLRQGEIVGLYGLVGSGRSELAKSLFGLSPIRGHLSLDGKDCSFDNPAEAMQAGLAFLPEDRLTEGIFANHSCLSNVTASVLRRISHWGVISNTRELKTADSAVNRFQVKMHSLQQPINTLSGGNQQKLVLGRWLATEPQILILDEPTRGVDVRAKMEIHRAMDQLAEEGKTILMISSDLPEVIRMSDRVLVMCEGRLTGEFDPRKATEEQIAAAAFPLSTDQKPVQSAAHQEWIGRISRLREMGILVVLLALVGALSLLKRDEFASMKNLIDVMTAGAITSIGSAGMTLVIASGGIDISIGSMLALIAASAGLLAQQGWNPLLCLAVAILLGIILGSFNSLLSTLGRIHPIIVTLAGISIFRGVMLQITGGYEVNPLPEGYRTLVDGRILEVPKVLWYALFVLLLNWLLINRTLPGRQILAVGGSEKAARLSGLSPWKMRWLAFAILGGLVGLASVMWGGYYGKVQSNTGLGWELQVIAAAVIGGCSIQGGRGTALGAFLGAILISLIYHALVILKVSAYWQNLFVGGFILGAVLLDLWLPVLTKQWIRRRTQGAVP